MKSVDPYLDREYHKSHYNCLHLARDVWLDLTDVDITEALQCVLDPKHRKPNKRLFYFFKQEENPVDPCIVLMRRPNVPSHVGVFVRGKLLHIQETGVEYLPLEIASRGFTSLRFYTC